MSRKQLSTVGVRIGASRHGFTLVELLVVMAILGVLAGLLAWGVNAARVAILKRAQAAEIANIAMAVEAYRTKYGDYPPDGSSWPRMEAHLRKAFPNILISELQLLDPKYNQKSAQVFPNTVRNFYIRNDNDLSDTHFHLRPPPRGLGYQTLDSSLRSGRVFDSAEALVFFLGGFSSDPQKPFTGPGGPFKLGPSGTLIYNSQRENSFFEFKTSRLTLSDDGSISIDETVFGEGIPNDLLPVYIGAGPSLQQGGKPIVYFDSVTYQFSSSQDVYFNFFVFGNFAESPNCARPFLSTDLNTSVSPSPLLYSNPKTFQIMNAGYDNLYGCMAPKDISNNNPLVLFTTPKGNAVAVDTTNGMFYPPTSVSPIPYYLQSFGNFRPVNDNSSNFIDGPTFGESQ